MDAEGRVSLRSMNRDSNSNGSNGIYGGGGQLKWKRKSELSKSIASDKSRISIKGNNQYEYTFKQDDPFKNFQGRNSIVNNNEGNSL